MGAKNDEDFRRRNSCTLSYLESVLLHLYPKNSHNYKSFSKRNIPNYPWFVHFLIRYLLIVNILVLYNFNCL